VLRLFKKNYPIRNIFFVIAEGLTIYLALLTTTLLMTDHDIRQIDQLMILKMMLITLVCQASMYYNDLYDIRLSESIIILAIHLLQAMGIAAICLGIIYFIFPHLIVGDWVFMVSLGFLIVLIAGWRFLYRYVLDIGLFNQKIAILGSGPLAHKIIDQIKDQKDSGYTISFVVNSCGPQRGSSIEESRPKEQPDYSHLCDTIHANKIKKVVVALEEKRGCFPTKELLECRMNGIEIINGYSFYENLTGKLVVEHLEPSWLIFSDGFHKSKTTRFLKRSIDLILSVVMIVMLSPLMLVVAILLKMDSNGPVIYSQDRLGEFGRPYRIHKFRSMIQDAEKYTGPKWADEDDPRITRVGRFIRKWRIDEIPQLFNVLKGEMSFVGPRPERAYFAKELEQKIPLFRERLNVKPGITGWAQICYNYGASVEDAIEKLNYDLFYIKNMSIFMEVMIVLRTIKTVIGGEGAR
jgi:sugar transferase (PEP-CTERM system associated)